MRRLLKWLFLLVLAAGCLVGAAMATDISVGALGAISLLALLAWFFGG